MLNRDGSFNVRRRGTRLRDIHLFRVLVEMSWPRFLAVLFTGLLSASALYAGLYLLFGADGLENATAETPRGTALNVFFFSVQTLTTVGYGGISPRGLASQVISSLEAMTGVLGFAFAAGLLYGRFSRPSVRIGFSRQAIIAPYQGGSSLQFRLVNQRSSALTDLTASVILMTVEGSGASHRRTYAALGLERTSVDFLPLTWTVVHGIDESSPLHGLTADDLAARSAELIVLIRAFDDTFSQVVHTRHSYRADEILWGYRFKGAFTANEHGDLVLRVDEVHAVEEAPLTGRR
jgi:inward rectifier potassium channel